MTTLAFLLLGAACAILLWDVLRRRRVEAALRDRETLYRLVLGRLPDSAVVLFDHDLRFLLAGLTVREALPDLAGQLEPMYRAALAGQENVFDVDHGGRRFVTRAVPVRARDGTVAAGMMMAVDASEAHAREELISRLNRDLEAGVAELTAANQELEAFSYSVSHDLRAPLRHISGFVDLLRRGSAEKLDEKGRRQLDMIARAARNMGELIDDLLAFSRVGRTQLQREPVDLSFLVREVVQPVRLETAGRNIEWQIGDLPAVMADPSLLRIVLANLVGNAVKYSRTRERPRIEIGSVPASGQPDGEAVVYVRDNGVGFDPEYAGKLFGVFQRLHRADEFEGTGIGLATVRRIVHRHGGRTWAEGRLDGGATFYFSLPGADDTASGDAGPRAERSA
jgi:signal transduction histidine kinase